MSGRGGNRDGGALLSKCRGRRLGARRGVVRMGVFRKRCVEGVAAAAAAPARVTVLVVEDDPDVRALAVEVLEESGYTVFSAADGREALAVLQREHAIGLMFTDIMMPGGLDGVDLAERALSVQPHLKVLFASGYADRAVLETLTAGHPIGFISKPYRPREVTERVRRLLTG